MSTDPTPETPQSARPEQGGVRSDRLWPWYLLTALYLGGCGIVLYDRAAEFGEFFSAADGTPGRLRLNEIGDIAAGIFAPLAFLWLFVATQLQRRELSLQRAELAETRAVLADQQRELEKSAKESNHQPEIMHATLGSTKSKEDYESFNLKLYYLARKAARAGAVYIRYEKWESIFDDEPSGWHKHAISINIFPRDFRIDPAEPGSVDDYFERLYLEIHNATMLFNSKFHFRLETSENNIEAMRLILVLSRRLFLICREAKVGNSDLINLRLENLNLNLMAKEMAEIANLIKYRSGREFNKP